MAVTHDQVVENTNRIIALEAATADMARRLMGTEAQRTQLTERLGWAELQLAILEDLVAQRLAAMADQLDQMGNVLDKAAQVITLAQRLAGEAL